MKMAEKALSMLDLSAILKEKLSNGFLLSSRNVALKNLLKLLILLELRGRRIRLKTCCKIKTFLQKLGEFLNIGMETQILHAGKCTLINSQFGHIILLCFHLTV